MWVAVGTSGSSFSLDDGVTWVTFDQGPFNAVGFSGPVGWAAGQKEEWPTSSSTEPGQNEVAGRHAEPAVAQPSLPGLSFADPLNP